MSNILRRNLPMPIESSWHGTYHYDKRSSYPSGARMAANVIKVISKPQPWSPADATNTIRAIAKSECLDLILTTHAREQMAERKLIISDVLYVLKHGFVYDEAQESTRSGCFKYRTQTRSPNSGSRTVRVVALPDADRCTIKVVTVMWVD